MKKVGDQIDILIFHSENSYLIERLIGSRRFLIFRPEGDIECRHILSLKNLVFFFIIFLREWNIKVALTTSYIRYLAPKIVLTYIDNSYLYQRVAYHLHNEIRFLAIQNGSRLLYRDHALKKNKLFHDYFFVLGEHELSQYKDFNYHVKKMIPVGSLRNSFYTNDMPNFSDGDRLYNVCVVSQVRKSLYKNFPEQYIGFEKIIFLLNKYQLEHKVKICIALRRKAGDPGFEWEYDWYRSRMPNVTLIENNQKKYSTYVACDQSDVTMGMHSTAVRESYGRGNKILSCNFSGIHDYDFPVQDDISLNVFDYNLFSKKLDYLIKIDGVVFFNKHKMNMNKMLFRGLSSADSLIVDEINALL